MLGVLGESAEMLGHEIASAVDRDCQGSVFPILQFRYT